MPPSEDPGTHIGRPDESIMKRLGYIRVLHQQAMAQSYAPVPLNFSAVLALHDVMEYFFVVAVAHLSNKEGIDLKRPFSDNAGKLIAPDGKPLSSLDAVRRVSHDRNGFKHNGSIPGPEQVEHARRDVRMFLEGNCQRIFGIAFAEISLLHIVPQDAVRGHLQAGREAADRDDIKAGMAELALAFYKLMDDWGRDKYLPGTSFRTERFDLGRSYPRRRRIDYMQSSDSKVRDGVGRLAAGLQKEFEEIDKRMETIRHAQRLQIAEINMAAYARFAMIVPDISESMGGRLEPVDRAGQFHYTAENYDFCETFVVESALRIGQYDFEMWMPRTFGDYDRAKAAMEANGGRLPDNMAGF